MVGDLDQRIGRDDLDVGAGPGGFRAAGRRADQAFLARIGADRSRQHARDRRDRAVETEFAEHRETGQRVRRDRADRRHQAERNRQIVMAAFLRQVGGREVDGDAPRRQREPRGDQRRAHPLARLRDRLVGRPTTWKAGSPGETWTCTSTARASIPSKATVETRVNHACPSLSSIEGSGTRRKKQEHYGNIDGVATTSAGSALARPHSTTMDRRRSCCSRSMQASPAADAQA